MEFQKWEYLEVTDGFDKWDGWGNQGWELVSVVRDTGQWEQIERMTENHKGIAEDFGVTPRDIIRGYFKRPL